MGNVYKVLAERRIKPSPDWYDRRLVIELCENVHIHYRNLRTELSINEFFDLCRAMKDSLPELQNYLFQGREIVKIKLSEIDPFDDGHKEIEGYFDCGDETAIHAIGIAQIKKFISEGGEIMPIAVCFDAEKNKYVRMDGFKRFWAYKELGKEEIECYIFNEYVAGIQEGMQ